MMERKGNWFQTYTGKAWWPMGPRPEDVDVRDVAHALAFQCRFNGHTRGFYSIAQHSVLVSGGIERENPEFALVALLHDAAEAYLGDMVRPLKAAFPGFRDVEEMNLRVIMEALGVSEEEQRAAWPLVKEMDDLLLVTERRDLLAPSPRKWVEVLEKLEPLPGKITPRTAYQAEAMFLQRYEYLLTEDFRKLHGLDVTKVDHGGDRVRADR